MELEIHPGEIVGLVGENGAGKSTLLKIIIGAQPQTSGTMSFHGAPYEPKTPMDANKAGVGMVFQEQSLIVTLNVAQNIFFGHEKDFRKAGVINWAKMNRAAAEVLAASLKDNQRATLVGSTTLGKGSVQVTRDLSFGGALRYTAAFYKSPLGHDIEGVGVTPDVMVGLAEGEDNQKALALETAQSLVKG